MTSFNINSKLFEYTVNINEKNDEIIHYLDQKIEKKICVIDENIIKHHPHVTSLLQKKYPILPFTATEENKTLDGLSKIIQKMKDEKLSKKSHLIVVGGGIIQDVCALAAHLFYRGIPYTFLPTTLLSMADSCIGAKSGLNFNRHKNQLGAFYPPKNIFISTQFLSSLKMSEIYSGYGEILKLFIIGNCLEDLNFLIEANNNQYSLQIPSQLSNCIYKALLIKKNYIEEDEFDIGNRRILNYGHTFGHAIETLTEYAIPHGLSVVIGMDIANYIAMRLNLLTEVIYNKLNKIMINFYSWNDFKNSVSLTKIIECVKSDKKAHNNKITMALPLNLGEFVLKSIEIDSILLNYLTDYINGPGQYFLSFNKK